jgi:hypothetical protein
VREGGSEWPGRKWDREGKLVPDGEGMGKESEAGRGVEREEGVQRARKVYSMGSSYVIRGVGCCIGFIGGLEAAVVLSACLLAVQLLWSSTGGVDAVRRVTVGPHIPGT